MSLTKATYSLINGAPVNVLDYGAVGDNVADDTAAIQAAVTYALASGSAVYLWKPNQAVW
jgi:polygalacturonase